MLGLGFGDVVPLKRIADKTGILDVFEFADIGSIRFERMYMLHSVGEGTSRGGHAHRELEQFIVAAHGSFTLHLTRFGEKRTVELNSPGLAYYIPPLTWRDIDNFSSDAVCLVLASAPYVESDYIRDFKSFLEASERAVASRSSR